MSDEGATTMLIKQGNTVTIRGTVITPPDTDGILRVEIDDRIYRFHQSYIATVDPRPLQARDIVSSTLAHRVDVSGVIVAVDGELAFVRWDDDTRTLESVSHLELLRVGGNPSIHKMVAARRRGVL